ncbi:Translation initiation factor IF-2 [Kosakonia sp. BK9b]|uniref:hypothetical protein n=1 Tax=Kosakonia sp. TaxID=1916651 RepID=UPI0028982D6E|nr:hypothetical protein [Kosakonia sp.]
MYDDLGSLAEKLKMSGVSFQEMNEEDGETMQAVTTTAVASDVNDQPQETTVAEIPAASRKEINHAAAPAGVPTNTISWPKSKPVAAPNAFSAPAPANAIMESVAAISRPAEFEARERNPVRLDMLFTVIGK